MKVILAPDSYKGCLTSSEVCVAISSGITKVSDDIEIMQFPSSDGGEGFCDCMRNIFGGDIIEQEVTYPLGNKGFAEFVFNHDSKTAFIELAAASGLTLVPVEKRDIMAATTYGTGELMKNAILLGAKNIIIGLGGSATNDCGIGIMSALGYRFFDSDNNELQPNAASLGLVERIDKEYLIDISDVNFIAACDVNNPLCGEFGAAEVFSRQKGATEEQVKLLDGYLYRFAKILGIDPNIAGSGAAGGAGAALISVFNAKYVSGASLLVDSQPFKAALDAADLVITGEGNTDAQTAFGKLVSVVLTAAKSAGKKAIILSGGLSDGYEKLFDIGADEIYSLTQLNDDVSYCINHASEMIGELSFAIFNK